MLELEKIEMIKIFLENLIKVWSRINTRKQLERGIIKKRNHLAYKSSYQFFSFNIEPLMLVTSLDI